MIGRCRNTYLDSVYLPWLVGLMCGLCEHATRLLQERASYGHKKTLSMSINSTQLTTDWQEILRIRKWTAKPGVMRASLAKRTPEIYIISKRLDRLLGYYVDNWETQI